MKQSHESTLKPKILLVNKFYYPRGGDCICVINLEKLLLEMGHQVAIFAMEYEENLPHRDTPLFATNVNFQGAGIGSKLDAVKRIFGWGDIQESFKRILADFKPDVVHLHNIHSYLSPVVARLAKEAGCRVVWSMHDYKLMCPSYSFLHNDVVCEKCLTNPQAILQTRCMKGSLVASVLAYLEGKRWNKELLDRWVDNYIAPSHFMASKLAQFGFNTEKIHPLCNFIEEAKVTQIVSQPVPEKRDAYYCYVGRLSTEKGVESLLQAAAQLPYELRIAGDGPLREELQERYAQPNIHFLGRQSSEEVVSLMRHAQCSVMPSICYDNNPLAIIESLCCGTPVVGHNIGGIPELIQEGVNGFIVPPQDTQQMCQSIEQSFKQEWNYKEISRSAISDFSAKEYYYSIYKLYLQND